MPLYLHVMGDTYDKPVRRLPRGITGFYGWRDTPPPSVDPSVFKAACYEAARIVGATVTYCVASGDENIRNYHASEIHSYTDGLIGVIGNAHYPLVAFVRDVQHDSVWQFIDIPSLAAAFHTASSFTPLAAEDVMKQPTPDALRELSDTEREQIRAWKPRRIGDIIFNSWD